MSLLQTEKLDGASERDARHLVWHSGLLPTYTFPTRGRDRVNERCVWVGSVRISPFFFYSNGIGQK